MWFYLQLLTTSLLHRHLFPHIAPAQSSLPSALTLVHVRTHMVRCCDSSVGCVQPSPISHHAVVSASLNPRPTPHSSPPPLLPFLVSLGPLFHRSSQLHNVHPLVSLKRDQKTLALTSGLDKHQPYIARVAFRLPCIICACRAELEKNCNTEEYRKGMQQQAPNNCAALSGEHDDVDLSSN